MTIVRFFLVILLAFFSFAMVALAQETSTTTADEAVNLDENIEASDLGISEPMLLPDSPFYFLKEWGRNIQSFFTFNPVAKAELKERFANEKLLEVRKMVEQNKSREGIEKAVHLYQQEIGEAERITQKIREKAEESEQVGKFLDKYIQHQALHQRILQKLQEQVPADVYEKIEQTRQEHLEKFGQVMTRLENKENLQERLEKNLEEVKGSQFKNFKNLEVLIELGDKVPEAAKEALQKAQENALKRLKGNLEQMSPEDQEKFKEYLEKININTGKQLEILENLKEELKENPELKEKLLQARERILEKVEEKIQNIQSACPSIQKPAADFCQQGRIVIKKDKKGCVISFECIIPAEIETPKKPEKPAACITLWDPVCGEDGKTYSNECFARVAEVKIDYKGTCKEEAVTNILKRKIEIKDKEFILIEPGDTWHDKELTGDYLKMEPIVIDWDNEVGQKILQKYPELIKLSAKENVILVFEGKVYISPVLFGIEKIGCAIALWGCILNCGADNTKCLCRCLEIQPEHVKKICATEIAAAEKSWGCK